MGGRAGGRAIPCACMRMCACVCAHAWATVIAMAVAIAIGISIGIGLGIRGLALSIAVCCWWCRRCYRRCRCRRRSCCTCTAALHAPIERRLLLCTWATIGVSVRRSCTNAQTLMRAQYEVQVASKGSSGWHRRSYRSHERPFCRAADDTDHAPPSISSARALVIPAFEGLSSAIWRGV